MSWVVFRWDYLLTPSLCDDAIDAYLFLSLLALPFATLAWVGEAGSCRDSNGALPSTTGIARDSCYQLAQWQCCCYWWLIGGK